MKIIIIAAALLASTSAVAQTASDDLVGQLSGDCSTEEAVATRDKPQSRGFKIAKKEQAAPAPTIKAQPAKTIAKQTTARPNSGRANINVTFVTGSAQLTESGKRSLSAVASAFNAPALASKKFRVEGHTDASGNRDKNIALSEQRAQSVVDFLAEQGVSASRFAVRGYGPDKPVSANPAANRRVEVVVVN